MLVVISNSWEVQPYHIGQWEEARLRCSLRISRMEAACLLWAAPFEIGRRDPGGRGVIGLQIYFFQHSTLALISSRQVV